MRCTVPLLLMLTLLVPCAAHAQDAPTVHVVEVRGPVARGAIVRALDPMTLLSCQHTHMGHPVRFTLIIDPSGAASISDVTAHEEARSYVPCIRRHVSSRRFGARPDTTRARVTIVFHPSAVAR